MINRFKKDRLLGSTLLAGLAIGGMVSVSAAQAQEGDEAIVVTGTRIKQPGLVSNSPIAFVGAEEIATTGTVNIENILNEMPQILPGFSETSNNPGSGTASVDLRALTPTRTLVLVDGKRFITTAAPDQSAVAGVVDINSIPAALIERIDVVTGGASAVYGSDAIAGVVNFILNDDFEGMQFDTTYEITEEGDGETWDYSFTFGAPFADGKGHVIAYAGFTDRQPLLGDDRDFTAVELDDDGEGGLAESGSPTGQSGSITDPIFFPGFDGVPDDPNDPDSIGQQPSGDGISFLPDGTAQVYDDIYNFAPSNYLQVPQKRFTATSLVDYDINEHIEFYGRFSFVNSQVPNQLAPTPIADTFEIDLNNNPFITDQVRDIILNPQNDLSGDPVTGANGINDFDQCFDENGDPQPGAGIDGCNTDGVVNVTLRRRMPDEFPRIANHETNAFQLVGGFRGDFGSFLTGWDWDVSYQYGRSVMDVTLLGDAQKGLFQQALNSIEGPDGPRCVDQSGGCVPVNPFGAGNLTAEQFAFFDLQGLATGISSEDVASASMSGDLGPVKSPLAADPIALAIGTEWRQEKYGVFPDQNFLTNNILGFDPIAMVDGKFDVTEFFGEARVPIVQDKPFFHDLALELGYRYSDYSTVGGVDTYKYGGEWAPVEGLRFRGLFQHAVRAPNIFELFAPQSETQEGGNDDPCSNEATAEQQASQAVRDACIATGVPAGQVFNIPTFASNQAPITIGGNPDLDVEASDTFTVGVVVQPAFLPDLTVQVDYYSIELEDAISGLYGSAAALLGACYNVTVSDPLACSAIRRRPSGAVDINGGIDQRNANIASIETSGVDLNVTYNFDLGEMFNNDGLGDLRAGFALTYMDKYDVTPNPTAEAIDCPGSFGDATCSSGAPMPEWRWIGTLGYGIGPVTIDGRWNHIGEVTDFRSLGGDPDNEVAVDTIEGHDYFDVNAGWDVNDTVTLRFGVANITDEDYPIVGDTNEQSNGFPSTYTPFGRQYFISLRLRR